VSYASGTATQLANAVAACLVMAVVKLCAAYFYYIPRAALGAIIEVALLNLLDWPSVQRECRRSKLDALVVLVTFAVTLTLDTELGLLAGLAASALCLYWMPRGGALLTRLLLHPTLKRRPRCDVLVIDLARYVTLSLRIRARLRDYLRHERAARGAGPHMLVLLDGGRLVVGDGEGAGKRAKVGVVGAVSEVVVAAAGVGIPKEMVVPVGPLPSDAAPALGKPGSKGSGPGAGEEKQQQQQQQQQQQHQSPLLSPEQEVARGVLERAHSLGLVCEYGAQIAERLHGIGNGGNGR
jgi:hypothetical protein